MTTHGSDNQSVSEPGPGRNAFRPEKNDMGEVLSDYLFYEVAALLVLPASVGFIGGSWVLSAKLAHVSDGETVVSVRRRDADAIRSARRRQADAEMPDQVRDRRRQGGRRGAHPATVAATSR